MITVQHDPGECKQALARTVTPVVVDLETTGLRRHDQMVSAGLLIDGVAHILFARSMHASIFNIPLTTLYDALRPLERPDLTIVGHNTIFDLSVLRREGIVVQGDVRDTLKLLRLIDQDRGRQGKGSDIKRPRRDLTAPDGISDLLNYKLKDVVGQLLHIRMPHLPGRMELEPYEKHARYLACDLVGTWKLYNHLWPQLSWSERQYYKTLVSPLIHILVAMSHTGVHADAAFAVEKANQLDALMQRLSANHERQFGVPLGMDRKQMADWLFHRLRLPVAKRKRLGRKVSPSLDSNTLKRLIAYTEDENAKASLRMIQEYREAASLLVRLRSLPRHIDRPTSRVHSQFDDRQATGRVSSRYPNLQQVAKPRTIAGEDFRSRNFLRASPGYELAVFDIAQADIRVLIHMVESFGRTSQEHQKQLRNERDNRLKAKILRYDCRRKSLRNPNFKGVAQAQPLFSPSLPADLAADFADPQSDFYTIVATRFLKRAPKDKAERNRFKLITLSTVNGQGPASLSQALECSEDEAKRFLRDLDTTYPKVAGYKQLMNWQIAYTGQTETFMGRRRTVTAHRWMVTEPQVQIMVSYKNREVYWLDVVPLQPSLRVLTTFVLKAWNARTGKLIYDHQRGRLSSKWYHLFDDRDSQYLLPIRNWGWRSIRRVRCRGEEAVYEGFETTARSAFNFICQGGTADVCKLMMIRSQPLCHQFEARLLLQIHDELVFEVPKDRIDGFFGAVMPVLQQEPCPGFKVPIIVEAKRGERFGELVTAKPS